MKNVSSWLIVFFIIMFWGFRVIVAVSGALGDEGTFKPIDNTAEVVLLFVVLILVPFIFKRKLWAGIAYLGAYGWYFGRGLFTDVGAMINGENLSEIAYLNMFIAFLGVVIPIVAVFDILFDKARLKNPTDSKTDWYYKNEKYDRQLDERADKNNYRTL